MWRNTYIRHFFSGITLAADSPLTFNDVDVMLRSRRATTAVNEDVNSVVQKLKNSSHKPSSEPSCKPSRKPSRQPSHEPPQWNSDIEPTYVHDTAGDMSTNSSLICTAKPSEEENRKKEKNLLGHAIQRKENRPQSQKRFVGHCDASPPVVQVHWTRAT